MADEVRNYWWLNAKPAIWSFSDFAPGEENDYTQFNENGRPRKIQKYFSQVRSGDLVIGYATSPKQQIVCLCKITRPLEDGAFHFTKVLDFPNPVPSSDWTADPQLTHSHFQGSLFKLSQDQWDGFIQLVKERNPDMTIPQESVVNDLEARLDAFLASFKPTEEILAKRQKDEAIRKVFVSKFPLETLDTLTPEQYCIGRGDQDNFCWWIERGTMGFSRFFPGSSRSYGMYFKKADSSICKTRSFEKWMNSSKIQFDEEALRRLILEPIQQFVLSGGKSDGSPVVGNGFQLKIAILYRPDAFIWINSPEWLEKIVEALHLPSDGTFVANNLAIKGFYDRKKKQFPDNDFQQSEFITFIEEALNLKEKKADSLSATIQELPMKRTLNTILYGPPGTGKTHDVVNHVLEIIDGVPMPVEQTAEIYAAAKERFDELKVQGRVGFVTFHQSYGYEDFIEGIRPVLGDNVGDSVAYELHDGVFKEFCKQAHRPSAKSMSDFGLNANPVIWKVSLEGTGDNETRRDCLKNGRIRIGWDDYGPVLDPESLQEAKEGRSILGAFVDGISVGDIVLSCWSASEIDAIGIVTGEYEWHDEFKHYKRVRAVRWLVKDIRENIVELNGGKKLTLATVYRLNRVQLVDVLALIAKYQGGDSAEHLDATPLPYVFVIDEINRGNISKIFGELITLVEAGKRLGAEEETKVVLPYSGEEFGVPPNVYILGTMNTADRSIALLDTALRRRFDFVEMMPKPELLQGVKVVDAKGKDTGIDLEKMLAAMNGRIEFLLDREHTIGHAYFLVGGAEGGTVSMAEVADIFRFKIVPLLQEYFFEDYAKIRLVLGDASYKRKVPGFQFVTEKKGLAKELFPGVPEDFGGPVNGDRALYRINGAAFDRAEAYLGIYRPVAGGAAEGPEDGE
jgi:5-methylcytosine-specific restriction protein B